MIESIKEYCKVGIVHPMLFPATTKGEGPVCETIKSIAVDNYFDAIEITRVGSDENVEKVARMLKTAKVTPFFAGQPVLLSEGLNINDLDEAKRQTAIDMLKTVLVQAKKLGCKGMGYLSGKYEEATKEDSYQALLKSTKEICTYAKEMDMMIVL